MLTQQFLYIEFTSNYQTYKNLNSSFKSNQDIKRQIRENCWKANKTSSTRFYIRLIKGYSTYKGHSTHTINVLLQSHNKQFLHRKAIQKSQKQ